MERTAFEMYRFLQARLDEIAEMGYRLITGFWNDTRSSFFDREAGPRVNVTSTSFCVFTLRRRRGDWQRFCRSYAGAENRTVRALLDAEWKSEQLPPNNIYTAPIVLTALGQLNHPLDNAKARAGVDAIVQNIQQHGAARYEPYKASGYLSYWAAHALDAYCVQHEEDDLAERAIDAEKSVIRWAETEVHRQIAYYVAGDSDNFDAAQLIYSLAIYWSKYELLGTGENVNTAVAEKALEVIFDSTLPNGLWPKGQPIFSFGEIGNAYPFSFEMLDVLLRIPGLELSFRPYIDRLSAFMQWTDQHLMTRPAGQPSGWCSNHASRQDKPESWSTAAVVACALEIKRVLHRIAQEDVLAEFETAAPRTRDDSELTGFRVGQLHGERVVDIMNKEMVKPAVGGGRGANSVILYGPPGTGKTRLAKAVARACGWPLVKLGIRHFLREGYPEIGARAEFIFRRLDALENVVILFDEFEGLVRVKEGDQYGELLTSCMLELLDSLHERRTLIYFGTTNHLDNIEPAAIREDRFDLILYVGPPSRAEKQVMLEEALREAQLDPSNVAQVVDECWPNAEACLYREWRSAVVEAVTAAKEQPGVDLQQTLTGALGRVKKALSDDKLLQQFKSRDDDCRTAWT